MNNTLSNSNSNSESFWVWFSNLFKSDERVKTEREIVSLQKLINTNSICKDAYSIRNPYQRQIYIYTCISDYMKERGLTTDDLTNYGGDYGKQLVAKINLAVKTEASKDETLRQFISNSYKLISGTDEAQPIANEMTKDQSVPAEYTTDYALNQKLQLFKETGLSLKELAEYSPQGAELSEQLVEAEARIQQYNKEINLVELQKRQLEGSASNSDKELLYNTRKEALREQLEEKNSAALDLNEKIKVNQGRITGFISQLQVEQAKKSTLEKRLAISKKSLQTAEINCGSRTMFIQKTAPECREVDRLELEIKRFENEISEISRGIAEFNTKIQEAQTEIKLDTKESEKIARELDFLQDQFAALEPISQNSNKNVEGFSVNSGQNPGVDQDYLNYQFGSVYLGIIS